MSPVGIPQGMAYRYDSRPDRVRSLWLGNSIDCWDAFAGSHFVVLGPTNATSVLLLSTFSTVGMVTLVEKASIVCLLCCY